MQYLIRDGILYQKNSETSLTLLAQIQFPSFHTKKVILDSRQEPRLIADTQENPKESRKTCLLSDPEGNLLVRGILTFNGNLIAITWQGKKFELYMEDSQTFHLTDQSGHILWKLTHNGFQGGWTIYSSMALDPYILLGFFIFTRYLDKENEFTIRQGKETN